MTFILLTGAGFSYNWGGPLASELFSSLLANTELDQQTRDLLFDAHGAGGFEQVLANLQASADPQDQKRYNTLIASVVGIFNGMNQVFMYKRFELEDPPQALYSLQSFLSRFHALFTLNQDALIELHYTPVVGGSYNWGRMHVPGMKYLDTFTPSGARQDTLATMEPNPSDFALSPALQPYIKLHGSVNWTESTVGQRVLIMGGQKAISIRRFPILTWYHEEFRKMLLRPEAKLMVIGYSFSDTHINDAIVDGLKCGLKLFLVDPAGIGILTKDARIATFRSQLIGFSTRPISSTFGGDRYEHGKLSQFFIP